jgi:membrane-bound lytic murein transglycosylase B
MRHILKTLGMAGAVLATPPALAPHAAQAATTESAPMPSNRSFQTWIDGFRHRALAAGIRPQVFDAAFRNAHLLPDVLDKDRNQSEFTKPIWDYLDSAASETRVANGKEALRKYAGLLSQIEARYGVDRKVVVAIWGMESSYGAHRGDTPLISALATLAFEGRRSRFFEGQLIDALKILQHGDVAPADMTGSWAGAMGHTQFIPSSYLAFAVDFRGDGKRDIWSDDPTDALASTAAYLAHAGWQKGAPWGLEVTLPRSFDYAATGHGVVKTVAQWAALGVRPAQGGRLPDYGQAEVLLPAGARGAAFLIFRNFDVIGRYNTADAYVLGVGILADRIAGGPALVADWPRDDRALNVAERIEMQGKLTAAGFDTHGSDGMIGPNTIAAVRAFQRSIGMVPDGYASLDVLKHLR